jgi:hypothetical protein
MSGGPSPQTLPSEMTSSTPDRTARCSPSERDDELTEEVPSRAPARRLADKHCQHDHMHLVWERLVCGSRKL